MIEFSGKIENGIQAEIITKRDRFLGILGIIIAVVGFLICLIVWLVEKSLDSGTIIILIFSCICVLIYGICFIPTSKRRLRFEWNYIIKFEDGIITQISAHQNGVIKSYKICKVKKVIDYGKYYYLFLYRFDSSYGIVCQKDLQINGSIEEFEKLFEGKIRRKLNKNSTV